MCEGRRSFRELRDADLVATLRAGLGARASELDEVAPASIRLPGGRALRVHYDAGKPPWVESYLQDFSGMTETPRVGRTREPVVVHLLAPSRRPVQVTSDLAGFWSRTYPELRTQLMRRYPKHRWP
jgi:ATP-dependent helicase HrpB